MTIGRRWPRTVGTERLGNEQPVEPIGNEINTNRGDDQPRGINRFPPIERNDRECNRA